MLQAAYLLIAFRARVLAEPLSLARRLVHGGFLEEKRQHEVQAMIKDDVCAMLKDLANLPSQIADPNWVQKIDSDLRAQVDDDEGEDAGGGFVAHPSGLRRQAEQAQERRRKKTETCASSARKGAPARTLRDDGARYPSFVSVFSGGISTMIGPIPAIEPI
jgi:hypothetical protein